MYRVCVISANMGGTKRNIVVPQEGYSVDFMCYNDSNFLKRSSSFTPRMTSKIPKMLGWLLNPGYDYYIWMDARFNMRLPDSVDWFVRNMGTHDMLLFKHPWRSTIADEAIFIDEQVKNGHKILTDKTHGEDTLVQAERLCGESWFKDNFLIAAGAFCYSANVVENRDFNIMKEWFFQTCIGSIRDQISLPYCLQKLNTDYVVMDSDIYTLKYLR